MSTLERPQNQVKKVLGFTNEYYTLWSVSKTWHAKTNINDGKIIYYYPTINESYIKNLSKDYDQAVKKMNAMFNEWIEDLDLKGSYFRMTKNQYKEIADRMSCDRFKFGKHLGNLIKDLNDKSYVLWYCDAVKDQYPDAHQWCVKFLTQTYDDLVEYKNDVWTKKDYLIELFSEQKQQLIDNADKGHHFEQGQKIELQLICVDKFSFQGRYGTTNVITYVSKCGKVFKYMGSARPDVATYESLKQGQVDDYTKIKATVSHSTFRDVDETKLKRIRTVK